MKAALWLAVGLVLGATIPALAQEYGSPWRSDCEKPTWDIYSHRSNGGGEAQYAFAEYQACLNREATDHAKAVATSIFKDAHDELTEVETEAAIWGFTVQ